MDPNSESLNIIFLPFVAPGHMIPMVDMARLFASRPTVKVTIITTTHNARIFEKSITRDRLAGHDIQLHVLPFPFQQVGLPEGVENFNLATTMEAMAKVHQAIWMLQPQMEELFRTQKPDCIVSDMFYPWTVDLAAQLNIPRISFQGTSYFSVSVMDCLHRFAPHKKVASDTEAFLLTGLPDSIEMTRLEIPDYVRTKQPFTFLNDLMLDADTKSYGMLMNSFYELEPAYVDHFKTGMDRRTWHIGPLSLSLNKKDMAERGNNSGIDPQDCLSWLDLKKPNSVLYVSFGSLSRFGNAQLFEIASALESAGHPFIWVVRKSDEEEKEEEKWLPEGFEERIKEKKMGMIIRGWAPQVMILEHKAIGGFMTHCGWNSILESIAAGVPVIAWPLYAEQFYNEKLLTKVVKIGVGVGVEEWNGLNVEGKEPVKREKIERAVTRLMDDGDEAKEIRKRMMEMGEKAKMAVEHGGSSYNSLTTLLQQLVQLRTTRIGV